MIRNANGRWQRDSDLPRLIVCQNPACGIVKDVKKPYLQREQKYCSFQCRPSNLARLSKATRRANARKANDVRRSRWLLQLKGLTPGEIYKRGYSVGWKAGVRRERRRTGAAA